MSVEQSHPGNDLLATHNQGSRHATAEVHGLYLEILESSREDNAL